MQTVEISGLSYVTARDIQDHYKLTRKRTWQELQKANISYIKFLQAHFYRFEEVETYFNNFILKNPRYNNIGLE